MLGLKAVLDYFFTLPEDRIMGEKLFWYLLIKLNLIPVLQRPVQKSHAPMDSWTTVKLMKVNFLVAAVLFLCKYIYCLLSSRLPHWWRRRLEDTDLPRTTWATCPHLTSPLLRWQTPQTSKTFFTASASITEITAFLISYHPLDRNYEEWIWAAGSSAAYGSPEHEEVNTTHSRGLCW